MTDTDLVNCKTCGVVLRREVVERNVEANEHPDVASQCPVCGYTGVPTDVPRIGRVGKWWEAVE